MSKILIEFGVWFSKSVDMGTDGQLVVLGFFEFDINEVLFFDNRLDGAIAEDVVDEDSDGVFLLGLGRGGVGVGSVLFEEAAVFSSLLEFIDLLSQQQFALLSLSGHILCFYHVTFSQWSIFSRVDVMQKLYIEVIKIVI